MSAATLPKDCALRYNRVPLLAPVALALMAVAVTAAMWNTRAEPLWLDEAYSLYAAEKGWFFLWHVVPRYETHPPFYYSIVRVWIELFGTSVGALRSLGALALGLTVPVAMIAARDACRLARVEGRGALLVVIAVGVLVALSPALQGMARQVRPYPVMILVYAVAIAALLRLGRQAGAGERLGGPALVAFFAGQATMLWLHNLGLFYAAALTLGLAIMVLGNGRITRRDWIMLGAGHVIVGLVYLPALAILLDQAPTWVNATWLRFSWASLDIRLARIYATPEPFARWLTAFAILFALSALLVDRRRARLAAALAVLALLPAVLSVAVSALVSPVFIPRIMTALVVPMILLIGFAMIAHTTVRVVSIAVVAVLGLQYLEWDGRVISAPAGEDWYVAAEWLRPRLQPGDEIWAYPNEGALPLGYALRDRRVTAVIRPVPVAVPAIGVGGWYPTGSRGVVSLPRQPLRAIAGSGARVPTVWLLRLGASAYDKGDVFLEELRRTRRPVARFRHEPIDIIGLRLDERASLTPDRAAPAGAAATH
jgi:hypothetical protein